MPHSNKASSPRGSKTKKRQGRPMKRKWAIVAGVLTAAVLAFAVLNICVLSWR